MLDLWDTKQSWTEMYNQDAARTVPETLYDSRTCEEFGQLQHSKNREKEASDKSFSQRSWVAQACYNVRRV